MTVAQMLPSSTKVKALSFAPAPWNHLQPNLKVLVLRPTGGKKVACSLPLRFGRLRGLIRVDPQVCKLILTQGGWFVTHFASFIFGMSWVRWVGEMSYVFNL